jgi:hypothetical protein
MSRIYMLRGQGCGVLHEKAYPAFPTDSQVAEAMAKELELHGFKDGKPRARWVKVVGVELADGKDSPEPPEGSKHHHEGALTQKEVDAMISAGPPGTHVAGVGIMTPAGEGKVTNPGEPGWKDGVAEKRMSAARDRATMAAARAREAETLKASDMGELDVDPAFASKG